MPLVKQNAQTYLRSLVMTHVTMIVSIPVFAAVIYNGPLVSTLRIDETMALVFCGIFAALLFLAGHLVYKKKLAQIPLQTTLLEKTKLYRSALVVRLFLHQMGAIAAIVLFLFSGYTLLLCIPAVAVLLILADLPNKNKMIQALQPDLKEMKLLDDPKAVVSEKWYSRR